MGGLGAFRAVAHPTLANPTYWFGSIRRAVFAALCGLADGVTRRTAITAECRN